MGHMQDGMSGGVERGKSERYERVRSWRGGRTFGSWGYYVIDDGRSVTEDSG